jgi:hypothetical protein
MGIFRILLDHGGEVENRILMILYHLVCLGPLMDIVNFGWHKLNAFRERINCLLNFLNIAVC